MRIVSSLVYGAFGVAISLAVLVALLRVGKRFAPGVVGAAENLTGIAV